MKYRYYLNSRNKERASCYIPLCQEARTQTHLSNLVARLLNPSTYSCKYNCCYSYNPVSKQKSEEELKDKNQILEAVNKQLHQKLTETQVKVPWVTGAESCKMGTEKEARLTVCLTSSTARDTCHLGDSS
jgi:hypothetical protein